MRQQTAGLALAGVCTFAVGCSTNVGNNVLVEPRVCPPLGKDTTAAANDLLDQIVAKIPQ